MVYRGDPSINLACAVIDHIPGENGPDPMDAHLGRRIKARRTALGMSQAGLADGLGLSAEQMFQLENGQIRVNPGQLHALSQILDVPVRYFFDAMPRELDMDFPGTPALPLPPTLAQGEYGREMLKLLQAYQAIPSSSDRRWVMHLAVYLAGGDGQ